MPPAKIKQKPRSAGDVRSSRINVRPDVKLPPLDALIFKIHSLRLPEEDPPYYAIKVSFLDQFVISAIIKPDGLRDKCDKEKIVARGILNYDPADYEKMSLFANQPLIVHIQPLKIVETDWMNAPISTPTHNADTPSEGARLTSVQKMHGKTESVQQNFPQLDSISCCNIDILQLFLGTDKICVKKRMQPMITPKVTEQSSWDNLPLLVMGITAVRNEQNAVHHRFLEEANWVKLTVVGAYNMLIPYDNDCLYTAASKIPIFNYNQQTMTVSFCQGYEIPRHFNGTSFYPKWESLRSAQEQFVDADDKLEYHLEQIYNPDDINLENYLNDADSPFTTIWGSFHRSLLLGSAQRSLWKHLRQWHWPLEVHFYGDVVGGHSFMAFLDLFPLLYPGVNQLLIAAPLDWFNPRLMIEKCNCPVLMLPNDKTTNATTPKTKSTFKVTDSTPGTSTDTGFLRNTGADDMSAFVLVEVQFGRSLVAEQIPNFICKSEMMEMLTMMESGPEKRECVGRGQRASDWEAVVQSAAHSLRRVPHHGMTEFCHFNRQLSETRCRVEIMTSFWMEASIYTNNNFNVRQYLKTDAQFEELLMMSHVCLMKMACDSLIGHDDWHALEPTLRAARHARQLNDMAHALDLYLQLAVTIPYKGDYWRELSTCFKDIDQHCADICLSKALALDLRHPLSLLSKGCMIFENGNPDDAEPFFLAVLTWYPFWQTGYFIASAYFFSRELFSLADEIQASFKVVQDLRLVRELQLPRAWERELGDFWEPTLLLPGMSLYYDAADLLLRIRGIRLGEVCLGLALSESGETAVYFHLVALCYRLQGKLDEAICIVRKGLDAFGQNTYLTCLEAECLHQMDDIAGAMASFEKVGGGLSAYSILLSLPCWEPSRVRTVLVDLLRRQPSAYGWMALANDWLLKAQVENSSIPQLTEEETAALTCAAASAVQALKWDRRAGRAWATLAKLVKPNKRRLHCFNMAIECGFEWADEDYREMRCCSQESVCHRLGYTFKECRCSMCEPLRF